MERSAPKLMQAGLALDRRTICAAIALGFGALFVMSLGQDILALAGAPIERTYMVDVDVEGGAFAWASSLLIALNALLLLAIWRAAESDRPSWLALAFGFVFLSLDEMAGVHERIGGLVNRVAVFDGVFHFAWVVPALVAVALALAMFVPFLQRLPPSTAKHFLAAGAIYLGGAIGMEMTTAGIAAAGDHAGAPYRLLVHIEEGAEVAGQLLFLWALMGHAALMAPQWTFAFAADQKRAPTALQRKPMIGDASA